MSVCLKVAVNEYWLLPPCATNAILYFIFYGLVISPTAHAPPEIIFLDMEAIMKNGGV